MSASQNALFTGSVPDDPEFDHPAGAAIARTLSAAVAGQGWQVDEIDNWRDSGWLVRCRRGSADVDVILAATLDPGEWFLQIVPHDAPGVLGRLFGKRASADTADVFTLSRVAHSVLEAHSFRAIRWRWDGYPHEAQSTPTPTAADKAS